MFFFRTRYRIVLDTYSGFEAQYRPWWSPCYLQIGGTNTSSSLADARKIVDRHKYHVIWQGY